MLVGAYGTAIAVNSWGLWLGWAVLVGIGAAVLLGLMLGIPTLRLRADYLAIVTISAAEILRIAANSTSVQIGDRRAAGHHRIRELVLRSQSDTAKVATASGRSRTRIATCGSSSSTWALVVLASTLDRALLVESPWGRVVRAIREDEDAVRSLGKNVFAYKMQSLVLGGVIGGDRRHHARDRPAVRRAEPTSSRRSRSSPTPR